MVMDNLIKELLENDTEADLTNNANEHDFSKVLEYVKQDDADYKPIMCKDGIKGAYVDGEMKESSCAI